MPRCYESRRQNQEGWSSLHAHFARKQCSSATPQHKQKHLLPCPRGDCAQKIFSSFKTAEGRLGPVAQESVVDSALLRSIFRPFKPAFLSTTCTQIAREERATLLLGCPSERSRPCGGRYA